MKRINVSELTDAELSELAYELAEEIEARLKYRSEPVQPTELPF